MKRKSLFCLIMALLLLSGSLLLPVQADETVIGQDLSVTNGSHSLDGAYPVLGAQQQVKNAKSIILYELNTDTLLYSWNSDAKMYPSSLVKIMTALLAVEQGKMDDVVAVKQSVLATVPGDAVSAELQAEEVLTLQDLLYCMLVDSANDAAAVIADHVGGNQDAFVQQMNLYAQQLGCTGTQFTNAHGLHNEQQYTTARDVAKILEKAMDNALFCEIFSTITYTVPATNKAEARELSSGNFLMNTVDGMEIYFDSRVTGGRTGVTEQGERVLAAAAENGDMRLISILMGAESEYEEDGYTVRSFGGFNETKALLDLGFTGLKAVQVLYENQILTQYPVTDGSCKVSAGVQTSASTVLPENVTSADLSFRYTDVSAQWKAPVTAGEKLSDVQVWYGNMCIAQAELFAMHTVAPIPLEQPADSSNAAGAVLKWVGIVAGVLLGLVLVGAAVLLLIRRTRMLLARSRSRRYRRGRRRSR